MRSKILMEREKRNNLIGSYLERCRSFFYYKGYTGLGQEIGTITQDFLKLHTATFLHLFLYFVKHFAPNQIVCNRAKSSAVGGRLRIITGNEELIFFFLCNSF